ncbi:uncharacterized protein LOC142321274 [Lycorma delicatula]|uniref:uncharacterized protein LOC142321274 n=1 Tax=Lycorma delicatula TaxID=130591 RepID=UPI003F51440A
MMKTSALKLNRDKEIISALIDNGADVNAIDGHELRIVYAINNNYKVEIINKLINLGADVNKCDCDGVTPLMYAIKNKRNEIIGGLINAGADVNAVDKSGRTILQYAVIFCNNQDVFNLLITKGADLSKINGKSLFMDIHKKTSVKMMKTVLEKRVFAKLVDCESNTLLHYTIGPELINALIRCGNADVTARNNDGETTCHQILISEEQQDTTTSIEDYTLMKAQEAICDTFLTNVVSKTSRIKQFLHVLNYNQFTINTMNKICNRLLYLALNHNSCVDCITEIINNGVNVNEMRYLNLDVNDKALLIALKLNRDKEIISALIDNGADVNAIDRYGLTPLVYAINNNYTVEIINKLINIGANVNKCDFVGVTPLMYAIKNNSNEIIGGLINAGADVNAVDKSCRTILLYAVIYHNDQDVINLLIKKGADFSKINNWYDHFWFDVEVVKKSNDKFIAEIIQTGNNDKKNEYGKTFLMFAIELNMNKNIIFNIIHNGADINAADNKGYSPLIYAIMYECDMDVIIKLIEYGADVNVVDNNGLTPLKHAVHSRMFKEVIQILIDNGVNINIHNENNNTLLLYILKNVNNNKEHVSFVIQKGADV